MQTVRILVNEDEPIVRNYLRQHLAERGYSVSVAPDGEEGLFAGTEYDLDAAIVDLGLPKMPGIQVIRQPRSRGRKFPILILTARSQWQDKVEGLHAGADDYVVKPFEMEEIVARVQTLIRRANGETRSGRRVAADRNGARLRISLHAAAELLASRP